MHSPPTAGARASDPDARDNEPGPRSPAREKRVLILDLSVDPTLYHPASHWRRLLGPISSDVLHVRDISSRGFTPSDHTHLIVTGSEASIVEPQRWFEPAQDLIMTAVDHHVPVLGSCFGHQLIVRALEGAAHVRRAVSPELGWFPVETVAAGAAFSRCGSEIWMFCCHFDEVCDLPPRYRVLARTPECSVHAYALDGAPVWGIQAHPEIPPAEGADLLSGFARRRPGITAAVDRALAGSRRDDGFGATLLARFLEARC